MHHPELGPFAARVADIRRDRAEGQTAEDLVLDDVLRIMHNENRTQFAAHGVTFLRTIGSEKLIVKSGGKKGKSPTTDAKA